jgi:hypothetical protein
MTGSLRNETMLGQLKSVKFWVFVVLCSVFVYNLYYLINGLQFTWWTYTTLGGPAPNYYRTISSIGHTSRFIGLFLAIQAAYQVWVKGKTFSSVKSKVSAALILEAAYYVTFIPGTLNIINYGTFFFEGSPVTLFASIYFLQILLISPFLVILGLKVRNTKETALLKWAGIACVGYITAIWVNITFRWLFTSFQDGIQFLLTGITGIGFLPSIFTSSLAIVFAILGAIKISKNIGKATKWFGLSAVMLGAHFVIYLIYNAYGGMLDFAILTEVWAVSFLGLGLSIIKQKE